MYQIKKIDNFNYDNFKEVSPSEICQIKSIVYVLCIEYNKDCFVIDVLNYLVIRI